MPIKIEGGTNNISIHNKFWTALTKNSDYLALSQLWLCGFRMVKLYDISTQLSTKLNNYEQNAWNSNPSTSQSSVNDRVLNLINYDGVHRSTAGSIYLFAQGVSFVGDGLNSSRIGATNTGATKGLIIDGRNDLNTTNITFLETNVSFVDGFIRPWSVLVGHRSLKDAKLRCDIELFALEKWELNQPLRVRKSMLFRNAVPVNIDAEELNYSGDKLILRQVQFAFDRYEMNVYPDVNETGLTAGNNQAIEDLLRPPDISIKSYATQDIVEVTEMGTKDYRIQLSTIDLNNPPEIGTKNYLVDDQQGGVSLLAKIKNGLGAAAAVAARVQGAANDLSSTVAQGLNAVGMSKQANKVSRANQQFQGKVIQPTGKVIGTGQGALNGVENIGKTIAKLGSKPNS